ncbi:Alpha/Beta hydrolase protein [Dactylonectria estremocensis]|uniref:1-alkyl-2-acetylglycerophosphocholine esterase n=1 Tax=Dactylonectria estremocensis TaxID=1079267 RepID=A0A9P9I9V6_9HYPO|nr:Alpha/Beta hydrolase protein [Dactylonectria estremocensis]
MLALLFLFATIAHAIVVSGPSGPWPVSYRVVELTDKSRWDPYAPKDSPHKRRILTSFFLPIHADQRTCKVDKIDYLPPKTTEAYGGVAAGLGLPNTIFEGFELEFCKASSKKQRPLPVVIFSPGFGGSRLLSSAQAQSLASRGNVVITVDHPYEATIVEFPDGTVVYGSNLDSTNNETVTTAAGVRSQDVSFLIDQILKPSSLGHGFSGRLDTSRIFVYGHSLGGATSALVALNDDRVLGGLDMDGFLWGPVTEAGLDVPFFIVGAGSTANDTLNYGGFMDKLNGVNALLTMDGMQHMSFFDIPLLISLRDDIPPELEPVLAAAFGAIPGKRVAAIVDSILGMVTRFLFEGKARPLCTVEDRIPELVVVERDLKGACRN